MSSVTMDKLGRYEILEELGRGAMGTVYRARDPQIGRTVAIKTIRAFNARPSQDDDYRKRFFREAQAAGILSHPGIVTIFDVGEDEATQTPYIVMEYIAGRTLESLVTAEGGLRPPLETSIDLVRQLAEALDYAHAQNIVHRDIKPANIIVTREGRAKITDFGVARLSHSEFTVEGQLIGTPAYMSPEQLNGESVDGRSDLFSLGVILYWLLTGEKPFLGDATTVIAQILYREPAPISEKNASLSSEYDRVVSRALAKDPAARYQCGRDLARELDRLRVAEPPSRQPYPLGDVQPQNPPSSRSPLEKTVLLNAMGAAEGVEPPSSPHHVSQRIDQGRRKSLIKVGLAMIGFGAIFGVSALFYRSTSNPSADGNKSVAATNKLASRRGGPPKRRTSDTAITAKASDEATLQFLCWHDFDSADLSVWVDDKLVYETTLKVAKKRITGYLSTTVEVPPGNRTVRVQIKSNRSGYDHTETIDGDLPRGREKSLEITSSEFDNDLRLAWQD